MGMTQGAPAATEAAANPASSSATAANAATKLLNGRTHMALLI
jgi:hypothetical protein